MPGRIPSLGRGLLTSKLAKQLSYRIHQHRCGFSNCPLIYRFVTKAAQIKWFTNGNVNDFARERVDDLAVPRHEVLGSPVR
jgi:hypothetical protein